MGLIGFSSSRFGVPAANVLEGPLSIEAKDIHLVMELCSGGSLAEYIESPVWQVNASVHSKVHDACESTKGLSFSESCAAGKCWQAVMIPAEERP